MGITGLPRYIVIALQYYGARSNKTRKRLILGGGNPWGCTAQQDVRGSCVISCGKFHTCGPGWPKDNGSLQYQIGTLYLLLNEFNQIKSALSLVILIAGKSCFIFRSQHYISRTPLNPNLLLHPHPNYISWLQCLSGAFSQAPSRSNNSSWPHVRTMVWQDRVRGAAT
jgi:hypothetical protein